MMKFWRRRHRHVWGKWGTPANGTIKVDDRPVGIVMVQFRSCTECGLMESRKTMDYLV